METPDTFSRTFLPATAQAQLPPAVVNRHVNVLRRCAGDRDSVTIVAACFGPNRPLGRGRPSNLLMLTRNRLIVTTQSPIMRRLRLYLNAELHHLADVTWTPEPEKNAVQLALTAIDGVREHFWIRLASGAEMRRLDEAFGPAFRGAWTTMVRPTKKKNALSLAA